MKPNEILAALMLKGIRLVDIARRLNVSRGTVSNIIHRRTQSRRIQAAIAEAIGKNVDEVWPQWVA